MKKLYKVTRKHMGYLECGYTGFVVCCEKEEDIMPVIERFIDQNGDAFLFEKKHIRCIGTADDSVKNNSVVLDSSIYL